ncbi:FG-GAP-like repeat-containing protein [Streptomyces sp. TR02-1]|uniref:FG-GAP-like repeat-containing protein n=1 Tax=Streptomyces sp. TR02-1 TaxID=3385977 RepID=UPI00399F568A
MTVAVAGPSGGERPHYGAEPVQVHSLQLKQQGRAKRGVDRRGTEPFSMLGISWPSTAAPLGGTAEVRTRSAVTGAWGSWTELNLHDVASEEGDEQSARGATAPLWTGPSDGVEARVVAEDGTVSSMPRWLRLDMIDPGVTKAEAKKANRTGDLPPNKVEDAGNGAKNTQHAADFENTAFSAAAWTRNSTTADGSGMQVMEASSSPSPSTESSPSPAVSASPSTGATTSSSPSPSESTSGEPTATSSPTTSPSPTETTPPAPESTVTQPPVVPRAQWGADESTVEDPPHWVDDIEAAFVHHTDTENGYSCTQSPAMVRSLMTYHVQTLGWNDIGYNFVVDKCGTIFEGRAGGIDMPVYGAHTLGFNSYSTGISVLGSFHLADGYPSTRINEALGRISAYKLGQYGHSPSGQVTLEAKADTGVWNEGDMATLNRISGHRDGFNTQCPGEHLYQQLPEIRSFAASPAASAATPTPDFNGDGLVDMVAGLPHADMGGHGDAGMVSLLPGGSAGPVDEPITLHQGSPGVTGGDENGDDFGRGTGFGDLDGDGYGDLVVGIPGEEWGSSPDNHGVAAVVYGPDLNTGATLAPPTGDRHQGGRFGAGIEVTDVDSDGDADILVVAPGAPGKWYLYDGATLEFVQSGYLGTSAYSGNAQHVDVTSGDFDNDGYTDIAVNYRDPSKTGRVLVLRGFSGGLERQGVLATKGGRSVAAGDTDNDGYADLVIGQPYSGESDAAAGGQITVLPGSASGLTSTGKQVMTQDSSGVGGAAEGGDAFGWSVSLGDTNNDRFADVLVGAPREDLSRDGTPHSDAGMVHLLYGSSGGVTGSGSETFHADTPGVPGVTEDGDRFGTAVQLADVSGWGRTDLAIGSDGENDHDGAVYTIPAGSTGIHPDQADFKGMGTFDTPGGARLGFALTP